MTKFNCIAFASAHNVHIDLKLIIAAMAAMVCWLTDALHFAIILTAIKIILLRLLYTIRLNKMQQLDLHTPIE